MFWLNSWAEISGTKPDQAEGLSQAEIEHKTKWKFDNFALLS